MAEDAEIIDITTRIIVRPELTLEQKMAAIIAADEDDDTES